jgi:hypothetical protein
MTYKTAVFVEDAVSEVLDRVYRWKRRSSKTMKMVPLKATGHELLEGVESFKKYFGEEAFNVNKQQEFFDEIGFPYNVALEEFDHDLILDRDDY